MPPFNIDTIVAFLEEYLPYKVSISTYGNIVYETSFERDFKEIGGRLDFLHVCIEDNCFPTDIGEETIDCNGVITDYKKMVAEEQ